GTFQCTGGPVATFPFPSTHGISYTISEPVGVWTIVCTATDAHGNTTTASRTFKYTVRDTTDPKITVPANITVNATGPSGAVVTYTTSATDVVDGAVTVNCTPASGSTFHNGGTTVHCTATDSHHNTANKSFMVTVLSANDQLKALRPQ